MQKKKNKPNILLFPSKKTLHCHNEYIGYLIAENKNVTELIKNYKKTPFEEKFKENIYFETESYKAEEKFKNRFQNTSIKEVDEEYLIENKHENNLEQDSEISIDENLFSDQNKIINKPKFRVKHKTEKKVIFLFLFNLNRKIIG